MQLLSLPHPPQCGYVPVNVRLLPVRTDCVPVCVLPVSVYKVVVKSSVFCERTLLCGMCTRSHGVTFRTIVLLFAIAVRTSDSPAGVLACTSECF
jgi:hypothetical protein